MARAQLFSLAVALLLIAPSGLGLLDEGDELLGDSIEEFNEVGPSEDPEPVPPQKVAKLDQLRHEMDKRWKELDEACSTNAVFQLVYLTMTEHVLDHVEREYFDDSGAVADFAIAFAQYYFDAIDAYHARDRTAISEPWQEAFDWGDSGYSTVWENALLGINAHINYDLAQVTAQLDYAHPENKPDYDRINDVLDEAASYVVDRLEAYYGGSLATAPLDDTSEAALVDLLASWRENAWQHAKALQAADSEEERELVLEEMETEAVLVAQAFQVPKLESTTEERVEYCENNP